MNDHMNPIKTLMVLGLSIFLLLASCASKGEYTLNLMPTPQVFEKEALHPFSDNRPINTDNTIELLYATDRAQIQPGDKEKYYRHQRSHLLRLGTGTVKLGKGEMTWDELKKISLLKNRTQDFPLQVSKVEELGVLSSSISPLHLPEIVKGKDEGPARLFAAKINTQLDKTDKKEIFIYVHGFKVNFENPLLVASELWHYTGYQGVFIPYAWPSTTSLWAYAKDIETTGVSARTFRIFLKFLAQKTRAKKIHIIGYSAGTRLVLNTLHDLTLLNRTKKHTDIRKDLKLGNVILIGSDVNQDFFINALFEGVLNITESLSIYQSRKDKALGVAQWFFSGDRLGQTYLGVESNIDLVNQLRSLKNLHIIDVSSAESAMTRNGHYYFRDSPWVSSDILTTLAHNLSPEQRGLVRLDNQFAWTFPATYIENLKTILSRENPALESLQ